MITGQTQEICYAVDETGRYVLAPSAGWEPKNMANNQMNTGLLAKYARCCRWRVWLHLRPKGFGRLTPEMLKRYADIFDIDVATLKTVPDIRFPLSVDRCP